jgi:hypothetical protein
MPTLGAKVLTGCLIGVHAGGDITREAFATFREQLTTCLVRLGDRRVVFVADMRGLQVLPPEVHEGIGRMFRLDNMVLERSACLCGGASPVTRQFETLIDEAKNPARKAFRLTAELQAWLQPVLDEAEQAALSRFLAEAPHY